MRDLHNIMLVIVVGTRTEAHFLRSHVRIGSESVCLLGHLRSIFEISDSAAGLKAENLVAITGGEGDRTEEMAARERPVNL